MNKSSKIYIVIIVILILALIGITSYLIVDKIANNKENVENVTQENNSDEQSQIQEEIVPINEEEKITISNNEYNVNDYVSFTDSQSTSNVKRIHFSNLPLRTTAEFDYKNNTFVTSLTPNNTDYTSNTFTYETYKNILSLSTIEIQSYTTIPSNYYSININLDTQKPISNKQLLDAFNINIEDVYTKVLTHLSNNVTAPHFLVDLYGNVTSDTITLDEFKSNIPEYVKFLNNNFDSLNLYIQNGKLVCGFAQDDILRLVGLGSHMNAGLQKELQVVELN